MKRLIFVLILMSLLVVGCSKYVPHTYRIELPSGEVRTIATDGWSFCTSGPLRSYDSGLVVSCYKDNITSLEQYYVTEATSFEQIK